MWSHYNDGMSEIKAGAELRDRILERAARQSGRTASYPRLRPGLASVAAAAGMLSLLLLAGILWIRIGMDQEFSGFTVTVYAEDGAPIEARPQVHFPMGVYRLTTSSVPGFPLTIASHEADGIRLTATEGQLLLWEKPEGHVLSQGSEMELRPGETVYWTPLTEGNGAIATSCMLQVTAYRNKQVIGHSTIEFHGDEHYMYTGLLQD